MGPGYYVEKLRGQSRDGILSDPSYLDYVEEYTCLNKRLQDRQVVLFVGDSMTQRFKLNEYFPHRDIVNRGIFGDTTWGLMHRLEGNINNLKVGRLFIMIGFNDLPYRSDAQIVRNITDILARAGAGEIILQSLLPVTAEHGDTNRRIAAINTQLEQLCRARGYRYLNLHEQFVADDGAIEPHLTRDGVHLTVRGYEKWARLLRPLLETGH